MRRFLLVLALVVVGYGSYRYLSRDEPLEIVPSDGPGEASTAAGASQETPPAVDPPPPSEEAKLRRAIRGSESPEGDRERYRLALLLFEKGDPAADEEAVSLLDAVVSAGGEFSAPAASRLFRHASGTKRLEYAEIVRSSGPEAPAFAESALELGRANLVRTEDSARVQAWKDLSAAYFARTDPQWRDTIRDDLENLVEDLILSPRSTSACASYTVKAGDTLANIASTYGTTVEQLRSMNGLPPDSDLIHPGNRLKILQGKITVEIDKSDFRLDVRLDGQYLVSFPVGLGKFGKTPLGEFVIETKQKNPAWQKPGQPIVPYGDPDNPLGDRWLGFKNTEEFQGFGIHGTDEPETIGKESSEGCVRLRNEDAIRLYTLVPRGTPVSIRE